MSLFPLTSHITTSSEPRASQLWMELSNVQYCTRYTNAEASVMFLILVFFLRSFQMRHSLLFFVAAFLHIHKPHSYFAPLSRLHCSADCAERQGVCQFTSLCSFFSLSHLYAPAPPLFIPPLSDPYSSSPFPLFHSPPLVLSLPVSSSLSLSQSVLWFSVITAITSEVYIYSCREIHFKVLECVCVSVFVCVNIQFSIVYI